MEQVGAPQLATRRRPPPACVACLVRGSSLVVTNHMWDVVVCRNMFLWTSWDRSFKKGEELAEVSRVVDGALLSLHISAGNVCSKLPFPVFLYLSFFVLKPEGDPIARPRPALPTSTSQEASDERDSAFR